MKITLNNFSGIIPIMDGRSLPEHAGQTALNCTTESRKVKLRTDVPEWTLAEPQSSDVNGRKYQIDGNGKLLEDNISVYMEKPAAPTLEKVDFWTLLHGYTGKTNSPRFFLKNSIGIAGTDTSLSIAKFSYDEETSNFIMQFISPGGYYSNGGAIRINTASSSNVKIIYNGQEYSLDYPNTVSIPDADNGVYATVYFEGVSFTESDPVVDESADIENMNLMVKTTNIFVRGKLIKNKTRRNYVVTYWDGRHESPPSDASAEIDVCKGDTVKVTVAPYSGGHGTHTPDIADNAPAYYIYRTGGSLSSAGYFFVDEIPDPAVSESGSDSGSGSTESGSEYVFEDKVPDYLLQEQLSIVESPLEGMSFLHFFNGSLVAAKGNHVYFSEPHILNNWPSKYEYSFADDVTGLSVTSNSIIVFVDGHSPSILRGAAPDALTQTNLQDGFVCLNPDSICTVGEDTYYAAAEGLVSISSSGQYRVITTQFFSKAQWAALNPATMKCSADNFSIRLYLNAGNETESGSESGTTPQTVYIFDLRPGEGMVLTEYNGGSSFRWKTGIITFPTPVCFRVIRATTANGTGTFTVYAGHDLSISVTAPCSYTNGRAVRLRPNIFSREWCFQVESASDLLEIEAAESPAEIY